MAQSHGRARRAVRRSSHDHFSPHRPAPAHAACRPPRAAARPRREPERLVAAGVRGRVARAGTPLHVAPRGAVRAQSSDATSQDLYRPGASAAPAGRTSSTSLLRILFCVPARIVRSARRTILRLPAGFRHADTFTATLDAVHALPRTGAARPPRPTLPPTAGGAP